MNPVVIETIETQIAIKRRELQKIHADVAALERTLAILTGEDRPELVTPITTVAPPVVAPQEALPDLAYRILKEVERPLTGDQLWASVRATGREVNKATLLGGIYRQIKRGRMFKLVGKATFGLLEWDDHVEGNSKSKSASHANAPSGTNDGAF
jgi:hypothetical protein